MPWRESATKVCILIADAPPHGLGESNDGFPNGAPTGIDPIEVLDQMSMKGICVYSVGCLPALSAYRHATKFFVAAAEKTNGQAVALGSADSLVRHLPFRWFTVSYPDRRTWPFLHLLSFASILHLFASTCAQARPQWGSWCCPPSQ